MSLKAFINRKQPCLPDRILDKIFVAEEDGVVSYYFDGAEASLTPENMLDLTANEILNIQNGKSYYTLAASTGIHTSLSAGKSERLVCCGRFK